MASVWVESFARAVSVRPDPRPLTIAQESRLDRLVQDEPDATVVGWDYRAAGPPVDRPGMRRAVVKPDGRLVAQRAAESGR